MAYPKRGDVVYVEGKLLRVRPWNPDGTYADGQEAPCSK